VAEVRYIDPDATGGTGSGLDWANAYTSMSAWNAAEAKDLVTAVDTHTVYCRSSAGTADTQRVAILTSSGWVTSATNRITIIGDATGGVWDDTKYRIQHTANGNYQDTIRINLEGVSLLNLQVGIHTEANTFATPIKLLIATGGAAAINIDKCILAPTNGVGGTTYGLYGDGAAKPLTGYVRVNDTITYGYTQYGMIVYSNGATIDYVNCVAIAGTNTTATGFGSNTSVYNAVNCISQNNVTADFATTLVGASCTNNLSEDTTATTIGTAGVASTVLTFRDAAANDYHLAATDTAAIGAGVGPTTNTDVPTTDIDGDVRSGTTTDIGFDLYTALAIAMSSPTFDLAKDTVNQVYRTDVSGQSRYLLVENFVANGGITLLGSTTTNSSGAAFIRETDKVWIIHNGTAYIDEYESSDLLTPIRQIDLTTTLYDTEGICWMGYNSTDDAYEFATCSENGGVYIVEIVQITLAQLVSASPFSVGAIQTLTIAPAGTNTNSGAEGLAYDRYNNVFYVVGEGEETSTSRKFYRFVRPTNRVTDYTYTDAELTVTEPFDPEVTLPAYNALWVSGAVFDLSDVFFHEGTGTVLITSHQGDMVIQVDPSDGTVLSEFSIAGLQWEGITMVGDRCILIEEPRSFQLLDYVAP